MTRKTARRPEADAIVGRDRAPLLRVTAHAARYARIGGLRVSDKGREIGLNRTLAGAEARIAALIPPGARDMPIMREARIDVGDDLARFAPQRVTGPRGGEVLEGIAYRITEAEIGD